MKKRLVVFVMYDPNGMVLENKLTIIRQLLEVSSRMIIIVNGLLCPEGKDILLNYTEEVYVRLNIGMDYGAYQYAINEVIKDDILAYDSLVLCNDTFCGFFTPLVHIFEEMDGRNVDVWGLNRTNRKVLGYLHSYFLVFNLNRKVYDFLLNYMKRNYIYDNDRNTVAAIMEPKLSRCMAVSDIMMDTFANTENNCVYQSPDICLQKGLPILKRKCFNAELCNREILDRALNIIETKGLISCVKPYENVGIVGNNTRTHRILKDTIISEKELLEWSQKGDFYIFGTGLIGKSLYYTYFEESKGFKGFIASRCLVNEDCKPLCDVIPGTRVILGVSDEISQRIYEEYLQEFNVLRLW